MHRVKRGVALGAVLALGFGLSACGDDEEGGATGGELTIWADENRAPAFQALADEWGAENDVTVTITQIAYEDMKAQYAQQAPAGQASASAAGTPPPQYPSMQSEPSTSQRLQELETLRATGAVSEEEYTAKRAQILSDL